MHQSMMSMMVLAFHSCPFGESFLETNKKTTPTPPSKSLIKNIRLLTSVSLDKMKAFYLGKLGLQLIRQTLSKMKSIFKLEIPVLPLLKYKVRIVPGITLLSIFLKINFD